MSGTPEQPVYRAEAAYDVLADRDASREQLVNLLIERISPFLNIDMLREPGRNLAVKKILNGLDRLSGQFIRILQERDAGDDIQDQVSLGSMKPQEISRLVYPDDRTLQKQLMRELASLRDSSNADFLDHFGLLPPEVFSRNDLPSDAEFASRPDVSAQGDVNRAAQFNPLRELFPDWFDPRFFQHPEKYIHDLDSQQLQTYPKYARLAHWMNDANKDFDRCVGEAFTYLGETFKVSAPSGPAGQMYEMVGDLGSLSFAALLQIFLNNRQDLRTRFEALRLLEWSISFYVQEQQPIYQEQLRVKREIADLLGDVWASKGKKFASLHIPLETMEKIIAQEGLEGPAEAARFTARRLSEALTEAIGDSREVLEPSDVAVFDDRVKTKWSTTFKALLKSELYKEWLASVNGYETGIEPEVAVSKLKKHKDCAREQGRTDDDIDIQPVSLDDVKDRIGFTLGIKLPNMLDDYPPDQRDQVEACFRKFLEHLSQVLDLQDVVYESTLWLQGDNPHSSAQFRIAKAEGYIVVQREVVDSVTLEMRTEDVRVPVEIQLRPLESHVRSLVGGKTSHQTYRAGQIASLASARLHPTKIGGQTIYPRVIDPELLDEHLAQVFE